MSKPTFHKGLLAPRYWVTWLGFGTWWLLSQLPYRLQMALGAVTGLAMGRIASRRTQIARRNIELCFAHLSEQEQKALLREHLKSIGRGFFEMGMAWFMAPSRLDKLVTYEGLEYLEQAEQEGAGVLLMGMHFTHLDLGAAFVSRKRSIDGSYRPHANPVYDLVQRTGRERHNPGNIAIERGDVRTMIRQLKKGRAIWYAPDQDYGAKHSVFVPFMGVNCATITATSQLARLGKAKVVPFTHIRNPEGGYHLKVWAPLENFPSGDELADARAINNVVEAAVALAPEQYLWVHRRFKSRPEGEPDLYQQAGIAKGKRQ